ncbi:MAG: glycosyltransferase family protein [Chlamydia sp.]
MGTHTTTKKIALSKIATYQEKQQFPHNSAIIIQARLGSTRLPGKVLLPLGASNRSVLQILLERLLSYFDLRAISIIVATTKDPIDDLIVSEVKKYDGVQIYRGSHEDVLDRYYQACKEFDISHCVRITSDCPFIDPQLIHMGLQNFDIEKRMHYLSNTIERTLPRGFDFEIFSFSALQEAAFSTLHPFDREHVTPFLYKNKKHAENVLSPLTDWRITLDTVEDYYFLTLLAEKIEQIFSNKQDPLIESYAIEVIELLKENSNWKSINSHVPQKTER